MSEIPPKPRLRSRSVRLSRRNWILLESVAMTMPKPPPAATTSRAAVEELDATCAPRRIDLPHLARGGLAELERREAARGDACAVGCEGGADAAPLGSGSDQSFRPVASSQTARMPGTSSAGPVAGGMEVAVPPAAARSRPSGLKSTPLTESRNPPNSRSFCPEAASQVRATPSPPAVAIVRPSGRRTRRRPGRRVPGRGGPADPSRRPIRSSRPCGGRTPSAWRSRGP